MNKCGLITSGIVGILTSLVLLFFGIAIPLNVESNEAEWRSQMGDAPYEAYLQQVQIRCALMLGAAALWIIASVLLLVFACARYQRAVHSYEEIVAVVVWEKQNKWDKVQVKL